MEGLLSVVSTTPKMSKKPREAVLDGGAAVWSPLGKRSRGVQIPCLAGARTIKHGKPSQGQRPLKSFATASKASGRNYELLSVDYGVLWV